MWTVAAAPPNSGAITGSCQFRAPRSAVFRRPCSLSMNGCGGVAGGGDMGPVGVRETRTLREMAAPEMAVAELKSAVDAMARGPPSASGIIRLQVPIRQQAGAIEWLHAQQHQLPRCYFSGRGSGTESASLFSGNGGLGSDHRVVSAAGVGSAVFFQRLEPFEMRAWKSIRRFLSEDCPLIRAYGAIRFDSRATISPEWKEFGSFYFSIPLVEFDELEGSSMLVATMAWDDSLHWTWGSAIDRLRAAVHQINPCTSNFRKFIMETDIVSSNNIPSKADWDFSVNKALQQIRNMNSELVKVVLARCTTFVTDKCIDPVALLARLQVEGHNAYQFCIQPPEARAFIGNTPERLFHRKYHKITSEALAGTRARGVSKYKDLQNGRDLLCSLKDNLEFTIVRETIKSKMELFCDEVLVEPSKMLRKLSRVQHLCALLSGRLKNEANEFHILESLHPTPAVCGLSMEEARLFIEENETFDRGMYAGPVGWFGGSESEFAVGIRSALVGKGSTTLVYAGAGIVEGTKPSSEWEELNLKASQFAKLFQRPSPRQDQRNMAAPTN